jgi:hypothetical protein
MKTTTKFVLGAGVIALLWSGIALAQESAPTPNFQPVEMFSCTYNKGKGARDLDRAVATFNEWSDANDPTGYTAWTLTPQYFNADITFDVAWLGAWTDNAAMGSNTDTFVTKGASVQAAFDRVLTCDSHTGAQAVEVKPPQNAAPPATGIVMFSSCTLAEGVGPADAYAAHVAWGKYLDSKGSRAAMWTFYPGLGSGTMDFDYWVVTAYGNYAELAATTEILTNGGGWIEAAKIFAGIVSCDGARVYDSQLRRNGAGG